MSADIWAVRTLGLTGWRFGVAPPASASQVCSLAQLLSNPLQRQPQSHFRDEETEARRGPETLPRSHSRLGVEPRPCATTFPEILSNRETKSGPRWGRGGQGGLVGRAVGAEVGAGNLRVSGCGRSCLLQGPASGFRCAVGSAVSAHSPPPRPTGPNTRANTAWVSGSASACAACRPAPPAAPPSAKSSAATLTPCSTRASCTRGFLWSMTVSPAVRGDTEVWGAEVRGPKACPVTQVPSAGLPLTPSWLLGAALQTLPAQWSPPPATDALPGVTPALPVPHGSSAWAPVNPCELHCRPSNEYFAEKLRDAVVDGTPCYQGQASRDLCINGICKVCPARKRTLSAFLLLPSGHPPQAVPLGFPALPVKPFEGLPLPLSKAPPNPPGTGPTTHTINLSLCDCTRPACHGF